MQTWGSVAWGDGSRKMTLSQLHILWTAPNYSSKISRINSDRPIKATFRVIRKIALRRQMLLIIIDRLQTRHFFVTFLDARRFNLRKTRLEESFL